MHSFVIPIAPNLPASPDTLHLYPDPSIGITEIRSIQAFLSKKPLQSARNTVIIHEAHLLTLPAQQAFLKTLEEPPGDSQIYLVTTQPDSLLPTILSRCELVTTIPPLTTHNSQLTTTLITSFLSAGVGNRLALLDAQNFTRETALNFLDNLEYFLHQKIISHELSTMLAVRTNYELISDTRKYLKANVSIRLALDHLALNL